MPTGEKTAARFAAMRDGKQELRMRALSSITPLRIVRDVRTLRQVELDDAPLYSHVALDHHGGDQELVSCSVNLHISVAGVLGSLFCTFSFF